MGKINDVQAVVDALKASVAAKPKDYKYPKQYEHDNDCQYTDGSAPLCLVGDALHRLGVPISALEEMDDASVPEIADARVPGFTVSTEVRDVLAAAQHRQDTGTSWSDALDYAVKFVR